MRARSLKNSLIQPQWINGYQFLASTDYPPPTNPWTFLAQGDSWFSLGGLTTSILLEMKFRQRATIVNCANPGAKLQQMVNWQQNLDFAALLTGNWSRKWSAIFLSAGGNDLIAAVQSPPKLEGGKPVALEERLLREKKEWRKDVDGAEKYLSESGWQTFCDHLEVQFDILMTKKQSGINKKTPIFIHQYAYPLPRNAPVGPFGPWLYFAVNDLYHIPQDDWMDLSTLLIDKLAIFLDFIATKYPEIHVVQSRTLLSPATTYSSGESGDWANEIHPSSGGYKKLALFFTNDVMNNVGMP